MILELALYCWKGSYRMETGNETLSSMPMFVFLHCRPEDGWPWVGGYCSVAAAVLGHTSN